MSSSESASQYGPASKVLAALLSPWVIILVFIVVLTILHNIYYRPRLVHSYGSFPKSPRIFLVPPFNRRKHFRKEPLPFLIRARLSVRKPHVFWTDVIHGYDKPVTILSERKMILHFLATDKNDSLSWDAPLRVAWSNLYQRSSGFGIRPSFYGLSRDSLLEAFSPSRTAHTSIYSNIVCAVSKRHTESFTEGDLWTLINSMTSDSLIQLFFGESPKSTLIADSLNLISESLMPQAKSSKIAARAAAEFRRLMSEEIVARSRDQESSSTNDDYLQRVLNAPAQQRFDRELELSHKTPQSRRCAFQLGHATPDRTEASRFDSASFATSAASRVESALQNVPDHVLAVYLQTRLLVSVRVLWSLHSSWTTGSIVHPDPLFLVRKTRKDVLFGSTVVPNDSFVAISPPLEKAIEFTSSVTAPMKKFSNGGNISLTDFNNLAILNSSIDQGGIPSRDSMFTLPSSPSTTSFSPLLKPCGPMHTSTSTTDLPDLVSKTEWVHKNQKGSWIRRYPQDHLISMMVGIIFDALSSKMILTSSATLDAQYGDARSLWLPFPSHSINVIKGFGTSPLSPTSLYGYSRQSSASNMSTIFTHSTALNVLPHAASESSK